MLRITGLVARPTDLDFRSLAALPDQLPDISSVIPGRRGGGVRLDSVLKAVSVRPDAAYMTLESADGFSASVPLAAVRAQGLVVYRMGAEGLSNRDGGPVRFFIIDVEACGVADIDECANVKYLARIHFSDTPGVDLRPTTERAHEALHSAEEKP